MLEASKLSSQICDGDGANRIFNKMSDHTLEINQDSNVELCNYINLKDDEKRLVLEMRNHSSVRVWMTNREVISKKTSKIFRGPRGRKNKTIFSC